jgi:hypothetical protein
LASTLSALGCALMVRSLKSTNRVIGT